MGAIASQITSFTIGYSIVYSDADQRKHQSSALLAFVRPMNSLHKWPVTREMFPFDDVIMISSHKALRCLILAATPLVVSTVWTTLFIFSGKGSPFDPLMPFHLRFLDTNALFTHGYVISYPSNACVMFKNAYGFLNLSALKTPRFMAFTSYNVWVRYFAWNF